MTYFDDRVSTLAEASGGGVFGSLTWIDPTGQWWIAPLGSPAPDPDRPVPAVWMPMQRMERDEI